MYLRTAAACGLAIALTFAPALPAVASDSYQPPAQKQQSTWTQAGLGLASIGSSILYAPAKIIYGVLGLTTGSVGWILTGGDSEVANRIYTPSLRGTYVLTPRHLTGEEPIHFVGTSGYSSTGSAGTTVSPHAVAQQTNMQPESDTLMEESF